MPKDVSKRSSKHTRSARVAKQPSASQEDVVEQAEGRNEDEATVNDTLENTMDTPLQTQHKKKEKQQLKRDLLLQRIGALHVPYSKSHERRVKRKAQEQIGNGLSEIEAALPESVRLAQTIDSTMDDTSIAPPSRHQQGIIGEGKNATLSRAQRKRALKIEQLRFPVIRKDLQNTANAFQAIRAHATNTLVKHRPPTS